MPFTPAHVAAVLPLVSSGRARRWLDPWALVIGAMIPDMPIFLPFLPDYDDWHSVHGVVTIDVVAVIVVLGLVQQVLWEPLISLLPPALAGRAATLRRDFRPLPVVAGAAAGAATHVLWDSFTHSYAIEIWGWSWLDDRVLGVISVFRLLQYISSVAGLAIVGWWVWRGLSRMAGAAVPAHLSTTARLRRVMLAACGAGMVAGALLWPLVDEPNPLFGLPAVITKVGAGTLVGPAVVLLAYAAGWHWQYSRRGSSAR
ncbi:DUF4184 family protein [Thermoactinospora rubra]|uniref:DUF4184 family protein n=1 Tax=Thermoactinospora rubra TaxID=1088767 RepID=UPI000A10410F|nr:DUF4184 family protein [Thermoactinospora rubra]